MRLAAQETCAPQRKQDRGGGGEEKERQGWSGVVTGYKGWGEAGGAAQAALVWWIRLHLPRYPYRSFAYVMYPYLSCALVCHVPLSIICLCDAPFAYIPLPRYPYVSLPLTPNPQPSTLNAVGLEGGGWRALYGMRGVGKPCACA